MRVWHDTRDAKLPSFFFFFLLNILFDILNLFSWLKLQKFSRGDHATPFFMLVSRLKSLQKEKKKNGAVCRKIFWKVDLVRVFSLNIKV